MSSYRKHEERSGTQGYLPRGGACVSCRRRKMKCDGKHPVCGQCDRAGRAEDCEYTTGQERSTVQILEENISRLEARIQELQNPDASSSSAPVQLHQPYGVSPPSEHLSRTSHSRSPSQDLPRPIAEALITNFLAHANQVGFFLNVSRFQASFLLNHPLGHPARPSTALITATYLWAIRFSHDPSVKTHEQAYMARAIQDASTALSGTHPDKIMHAIQAEILLATYFFASGRFFEGKYHLTTAVSIVFSAGLHKIRSALPQQAPVGGTSPRLSRPRDSTEEGERILALWTVLDLDKHWAVALEESPNFEYSTNPLATKVDTPWPLEMAEFEQGHLPPQARTSATIHNFLNSVASPDLGISLRAIESKAAVLWERVAVFTRKCSANTSQLSMEPLFQEFTDLSNLLDETIGLLPSPDPQAIEQVQNVMMARRFGVVYSVLCASVIRLHGPFAFSGRSDSSRLRRLGMARTILNIALSLSARGGAYLNPIIGTIWIEASQVVFDEIALVQSMRASGTIPAGSPDERAMMGLVQQATQAMVQFTINIPLLNFQVTKIQGTAQSV